MTTEPFTKWSHRICRVCVAAMVMLVLCGCETVQEHSLTYRVWDKAQRPSCRPMPNPNLSLFTSPTNREVLVVYDALSERREVVERRAYFMLANDPLVRAGKPPVFVEPSPAGMVQLPVFATTNATTTNGVTARFPILLDRGPGFELYRDGQLERAHPLPVYDEGMSRPAQIALTPVAVTGDTLLAAGVVATAGAVLWIMAGCPPFADNH